MNLFKNIKGETIAETIIALSVLAIGITLSSVLMGNSLRNMNSSKSRVVAVNIAREGIEAMRNIRDTNWLKFSSQRRGCWNHMPVPNPDVCDGDPLNSIQPGNYIVYKDMDFRWRLAPAIVALKDLSDVYLVDIDTNKDTSGDSLKDNDEDMYNHISTTGNPANEDAIGRDNAVDTGFKRTINISYLTNNGGTGTTTDNRMVVSSTVTWVRGDANHTTQLTTHLSDYLGRDNLTD
jgi:hypothetical protein